MTEDARKALEHLKPPTEPRNDHQAHTFCPECGWNVDVDEDGCCYGCGATAEGKAVDEEARLIDGYRAQIQASLRSPSRAERGARGRGRRRLTSTAMPSGRRSSIRQI